MKPYQPEWHEYCECVGCRLLWLLGELGEDRIYKGRWLFWCRQPLVDILQALKVPHPRGLLGERRYSLTITGPREVTIRAHRRGNEWPLGWAAYDRTLEVVLTLPE